MERQIEQLIELIKKKTNYDKIYIIKQLKRDLLKNGYEYSPIYKKYLETKIEISENYIDYLETIVEYLESILK